MAHRRPRRVVAVLLGGAAIALADAPPARYAGDRLTIHAHERAVADVLADVAAATGATIQGRPATSGPITADIDATPLPDALQRLLGTQDFAVVYRRDGGVKAIRFHGAAGPATAAAATPPPAKKRRATPDVTPGDVAATLDLHPDVPVPSSLRAAVGGPTASFRTLLSTAAHDDDPHVRAEAARVLVEQIETDGRVRTYVSGVAAAMDEAAVAALARRVAGERAGELLTAVASHTQDADLREKARAASRQATQSASAD